MGERRGGLRRINDRVNRSAPHHVKDGMDAVDDKAAEALEDMALVRAMEEGMTSQQVSREEIFRILDQIG